MLSNPENYTVSFSKGGTTVDRIKDAGTYIATISPTDSTYFTGTIIKNFTVSPASIYCDLINADTNGKTETFNNKISWSESSTIELTVTDNASNPIENNSGASVTASISGQDLTVIIPAGLDLGNYTFKATSTNYIVTGSFLIQ